MVLILNYPTQLGFSRTKELQNDAVIIRFN